MKYIEKYKMKQRQSRHDYLYPNELNISYENNVFCEEFQVKIFEHLVEYFVKSLWEILQFFSLENAILTSYSGSVFAYYILLLQGSVLGVFYDGSVTREIESVCIEDETSPLLRFY